MPYSNTDQENGFLKLLNVPLKQFQPLVRQCTEVGIIQKFAPCHLAQITHHFQIWVWHTRTVPPDESDFENIDTKTLSETNLGPLSNYW